jgi:hypothetical protein
MDGAGRRGSGGGRAARARPLSGPATARRQLALLALPLWGGRHRESSALTVSRKAVQRVSYRPCLWMVGTEGRLANPEGALVLGAGAGQVSEFLEHAAEVVAPGADGGVVGAEGGLTDLQGPFQLSAGFGRLPERQEHAAELIVPPGRVYMVRPEGGPGDGKRASGEGERWAVLTALSLIG